MKKVFISLVLIILFLSTARIVAASYSGCGSTITEDTTLDADISCSGTALTIGADNITLDCAGHTITYAQTSSGCGINIAGHTGVTIKNCNIVQGNPLISFASGICLSSDSSYNTLIGNSIFVSGNRADGIILFSGNNNAFTDNTIVTYGSGTHGIFLRSSFNNTLTGNTITTNSTSAYGIYLFLSNTNTLTGNVVSTYGSGTHGIFLSSDSSYNTFTSNTITTNNNSSYGICLSSNNNTLTGNTITTNSDYSYGIFLSSNNNTLTGNTITTYGMNAHGIRLYLNYSHSNTIISNTITINGSAHGIRLDTECNNNNLTDNTITTYAYGSSTYGIFLSLSSDNTLTGNTITTNGTGACGIRFSSSSNNTLASNFIATSDPNAYGLNLTTSSDNLFYNNYISAVIPVIVDTSPNFWNTTKTLETNIVGGPYLGGNYWANPSGTGFSETCSDADGDGICDFAYTLSPGNIDYLPLASLVGIDDLIQIIDILSDDELSDQMKNSLISKLDNALKSVDTEVYEAAINQLQAFINQVNAQRGKKISEETADMLILYVNNIIARIKTE